MLDRKSVSKANQPSSSTIFQVPTYGYPLSNIKRTLAAFPNPPNQRSPHFSTMLLHHDPLANRKSAVAPPAAPGAAGPGPPASAVITKSGAPLPTATRVAPARQGLRRKRADQYLAERSDRWRSSGIPSGRVDRLMDGLCHLDFPVKNLRNISCCHSEPIQLIGVRNDLAKACQLRVSELLLVHPEQLKFFFLVWLFLVHGTPDSFPESQKNRRWVFRVGTSQRVWVILCRKKSRVNSM